jgi:pyruvate/2-oxoglutarate dehydrogenase complex dihydrolipoamide acyltransferase (E2) component
MNKSITQSYWEKVLNKLVMNKRKQIWFRANFTPVRTQPVDVSVIVEDVATPPLKPEIGDVGQLPGGVRASPLARRLAEDLGLDLSRIKGTGPGGRIVKTDIESYREAPAVIKLPSPAVVPLPMSLGREDKRIPLSRLRSAIGRRMVKQTTNAISSPTSTMQALMDFPHK